MAGNGESSARSVQVKLEPQEDGVGQEKVGASSERQDEDISDSEKKKRHLINLNKRLRKGILAFQERQETLVEFIEVEHGQGAIPRYQKNKDSMIIALGITDEYNVDGRHQRSPNYDKMLHLMTLANKYWKEQRSITKRLPDMDAKRRYENGVPEEMAASRLRVEFDTGLIMRTPIKRCLKCLDESHEQEFCPYKHPSSRTPEVIAMIRARLVKLRGEEGLDPLLSRSYKKRHFKMNVKKQERKYRRAKKKVVKMEKKKRKKEQLTTEGRRNL